MARIVCDDRLTSSLLVQSSWAFSAGARSKGVRPILLQILLHRWEWKNRAMPRTPSRHNIVMQRKITSKTSSCILLSVSARVLVLKRKIEISTQISITKVSALLCVDLRVCVEVSNTLNVHNYQLVSRAFKCKVTESLRPQDCCVNTGLWSVWVTYLHLLHAETTYLRCKAYVIVLHKARVRVVLDVLPLDVVLQVEKRFPWARGHFHNTHLHNVNLTWRDPNTPAYFLGVGEKGSTRNLQCNKTKKKKVPALEACGDYTPHPII